MYQWFLVYCKPNQDAKAEENLTRQGFEVFRPTLTTINSKISRSNSIRSESLFPRYVFLHVDPQITSISPIVSTFGVVGFVKFGLQYAIASDALVAEIKRNIELHGKTRAQGIEMRSGDQIWVDGHGFDHVKAIYCNPCGSQRAMVLLNILGSEYKLAVPLDCLSKVVG